MQHHQWNEIAEHLASADKVIVGASNGLSITEGLHLFAHNAAFTNFFGDLESRYGLQCILNGMTAHWPSPEEEWGFWSRLAHHYCAGYRTSQTMQDLKALVSDKDYFILTSNGECHFEKAGFSKKRIWEIEGNWLTMQCADGCHDTLYSCEQALSELAAFEKDGRVPLEMIPRCTRCGSPMRVQMAAGAYGNMFSNQHQIENWQRFYKGIWDQKLVILELGIGPRNQLIKAPLMRMTAEKKNAVYITINLGELYIPSEIADRSFGIDDNLEHALGEIHAHTL